ncbi:MAG: MurR/RpiR family transcriptional regulator [Anaerolineaceae bacterium]
MGESELIEIAKNTQENESNLSDFGQTISNHFNSLTKSEKRIATFLRRNQDEAAFLAASEISDRLNISEATVVRFARKLGFASYPSMRTVLQDNFRARVTHSTRLKGRLNELREVGDIFEKLTVSEIDYLTQALETVDRDALMKSAKLLSSARRIFVFGLGPSNSLVDLMEIRLKRFGRDVVPLKSAGREILDSLISMTAEDVCFVISFFDTNPALNLLMEYTGETGCQVILLTDTQGSFISELAQVVLVARRGPVSEFHSLVVPMTIINALLLAIAQEDKARVMAYLDKLDTLRDRLKRSSGS